MGLNPVPGMNRAMMTSGVIASVSAWRMAYRYPDIWRKMVAAVAQPDTCSCSPCAIEAWLAVSCVSEGNTP